MPNKIPISVFIICMNEERIIESCLAKAAQIADEIIVVDSGSTDGTLDLVKKYTDKIHHQSWLGYGAQKNHALGFCKNEWVLSLDADEVLTDELVEEIKSLAFDHDAYKIARKLFIADNFIRWGGYYPDYQLRLFKKSCAKFSLDPVHESVQFTGNISKLKNPLDHYAYQSLGEMQAAFDKFAELSTKKRNNFKAVLSFVYTLVYKLVFRLGFLQGSLGLQLAWLHARYSFKKYAEQA